MPYLVAKICRLGQLGKMDDPLPPGHVTWRMRIANFAIKMAHLHGFRRLTAHYYTAR